MSYEELLIALENIVVNKVTTFSTGMSKTADTSAPMEMGMAVGSSDEEAIEEVQAVY